MSNVFQFSDDEFEQIRAANRLLREFTRSGAVQQWLETQRQLQSAFQPLMEMQQQIAAHFTSFAPLFQSAAQLSAITRSVIIPQQSLQDLLTAIPKLTTPEAEAIVQPQLAAIEEEIGEEADEEEIIAFYASEQGERQLARVVSAIAALASDTMEPWMLVLLSFAVLSAILTGTGLPGVASFLLNAAAGSIISSRQQAPTQSEDSDAESS